MSHSNTPPVDVTSTSDGQNDSPTSSIEVNQKAETTTKESTEHNLQHNIEPGVECCLTGLKRRSDLNGTRCVVVRKSKRNPQKWVVEFLENQKQVEIAPHNLMATRGVSQTQTTIANPNGDSNGEHGSITDHQTGVSTTNTVAAAVKSSADAIEPGRQCVLRGLSRRQDLNNQLCVVVRKSRKKPNKWVVKVIAQDKHVEITAHHLEMVVERKPAVVDGVVDSTATAAPNGVNSDDTSSVNGETIFERLKDIIGNASPERQEHWRQQIDTLEDADYKKGCASQGISRPLLTQLSRFVSSHHPDWTTYDFCTQYVKPITAHFQCSLINLLKVVLPTAGLVSATTAVCDQATIFVSHAWKYPNHRLLSSLVALEPIVEKEDFFWIDTVTVTQHERTDKPERGFDWWCQTFLEAIKVIGRTVLVLQPYSDPVPLSRSWCLFEIFCTHTAGVKLDIVLDEKEKEDFTTNLLGGTFAMDDWVTKINLATAEATAAKDRENILAQVNAFGGGVERLNEVVVGLLSNWFGDAGRTVVTQAGRDARFTLPASYGAQINAANLLASQGKLMEAEALYRQIRAKSRAELGETHEITITVMCNLGHLLNEKHELPEAEQIMRKVVAVREARFYSNHTKTLDATNILATILCDQQKFAEAETLYRKVISNQVAKFGANHLDTLITKHNLASLFLRQGRHGEAQHMCRKVLAGKKAKLGVDHPRTLRTMGLYAKILTSLNRYAEAEIVQRQVVATIRTRQGRQHQEYMVVLDDLSSTLALQSKLDEAEQLRREAYSVSQQKFGEENALTLDRLAALGGILALRGKWSEAETTLQAAVDGLRKIYGASHQRTVDMTNQLRKILHVRQQLQQFNGQ